MMHKVPDALSTAVRHHQAGRLREAEAIYRQILAADPDHPHAWHLLGVIACQDGRHQAGAECIRRALSYRPDWAMALYNLGNAWRDQGKLDEAVACYERAVRLKPDFALAHYNLGVIGQDRGDLDEAVACYRRALRVKPDFAEALNNLGVVLKDQADLDGAIASFRQAVEHQPDFAAAASNRLYTLAFCPGSDARAILAEHRLWSRRYAEPLARPIPPHSNDRSPHRRLRIGYVSPNFRDHSQSFFTAPLLSAHDHHHFEIFCYADVTRPDGITARLRSSADAWRDIAGLADEQVAHRVRQDGIDILVDLTMHMAGNHLLAFARKPAPVQVCWLAYQGTTGLPSVDYRLTDPYIDPPGLHDEDYSEESVRLPDSFWCYDPLAGGPAVSRLPALGTGSITFGCLNNFCKVNDAVLRLWARVLRAVGRSRLMLLAPEGSTRRRTADLLEREGVGRDCVTFVSRQPRPRYLELHHRIDIGLDTFPYTGQTTSLDAFWMGVPVVTLVGPTAVARAGLSLLANLGLPELVAETPEQFVSIAAGLANDLPRLSELRATLRERMQASPLMDAPPFARGVEAAYREMWRRWCSQEPPHGATRPPA
jgi:predicted O-linked N-acetylglucosamine transferase (SPINDLY family)